VNKIHAPDGTPLAYDAYEPDSTPEAAALLFHGWADHAGRWAETGERLRAAGLAAYALDQRGHGRSGGTPAHLTRFSQLLGDLQAFRRIVRRRRDVPQLLVGDRFGGLVILRYLETQPGEAPLGAIVANPWLASVRVPSVLSRLGARFADLWPTLRTGDGADRMTAGARAEIAWAQRAVTADAARIESPVLFLIGREDPVVDVAAAQHVAAAARARVEHHSDLSAEHIRAFVSETRSSERARKME
jgi:alpha-beta hydrolase superfamily lysophospholipase